MSKPRSVRGCRTVRQFERAVRSQGGHVETGGRHIKLVSPTGGKVPMPAHRGDIATGTAFGMIKMLLGFGFAVFAAVSLAMLVITIAIAL